MTVLARKARSLSVEERAALAELVTSSRYELVPTVKTGELAEKIPTGVELTVTASPKRGIESTIDQALQLTTRGHRVVPHLAARLVAHRAHLREILTRLAAAGIDELFVVGGDGEPRGEFHDALGLLRAIEMEDVGEIVFGVAGYPEGHPLIPDDVLTGVLLEKRAFASYVTTQMCFDAGAISSWVARIRGIGIDLPVHIGVPGVVNVPRLLSVGSRIGVGASLRFLRRHRGLWRRLLSARYSPGQLLLPLAPTIADPDLGISRLHIYTFNQVTPTRRWQAKVLEELRR